MLKKSVLLFMFFILVSSVYAACPSGMVSYWTFDDDDVSGNTVYDIVGNNDGTNDGATTGVSGKVNEAFYFETGNRVEIGNPADLQLTSMAIMFWYKPTRNDKSIITKGGSRTASRDWDIFGSGANLNFVIYSGSNYLSLIGDSHPSLNEWHHVVAQWTGTTQSNGVKLYVDGNLLAQGTATGVDNENGRDIYLGGSGNIFSFILGELDEIAIFNRVLTPTEIEDFYNSGNGKNYCHVNLPKYTNFPTGEGTTDFTSVGDITSVPNMVLATAFGSVQWDSNVNAENEDYDSYVKIGNGFVSFDVNNLHSTINDSARVCLGVAGCDSYNIYYAQGFHNSFASLVGDPSAQPCNGGTTPACSNIDCSGNQLCFDVPHFDGFGGNGTGGGGGGVPEFSDYAMMLIIILVISGFFVIRKQNEE